MNHFTLEDLGIRPGINARGWNSQVGQSGPSEAVITAMAEASRHFAPIAELQQRASQVISRLTGAEAGCVASGDAACLALSVAACIARLDRELMHRLPNSPEGRAEVVMHRVHRNPYDHAVRAVGASIVEFGYPNGLAEAPYEWEMTEAIGPFSVAALYFPNSGQRSLPLPKFAEIAHEHDLPVIVDGAGQVPPANNLSAFLQQGADLVTFSGGKGINGPTGAGFLAGSMELVSSATLQQQDMHVRFETWRGPFASGVGEHGEPPLHGIGRMLKVGREEIVGLVAALLEYEDRDHQKDSQTWSKTSKRIAGALSAGQSWSDVEFSIRETGAAQIPAVFITFVGARGTERAFTCYNELLHGEPRVFVHERYADDGTLMVNPSCLKESQIPDLTSRLIDAIEATVSP